MRELVRLGEKLLVIVGIIYLSGSLYQLVPDPVSSLTQYGVYGMSFLLLLARWRRTVRTLLRDPFLWLLLTLTLLSFLWSAFPKDTLKSGIVACQTASFSLYVASCYTLKQQIRLMAWAMGIIGVISVLYTLGMPSEGIHTTGDHAGAWRGLYVHKNILAEISAYSALIFLFLTMILRRFTYIAWGGLFLWVALLILSTSKTGLMVFITVSILLQLYKGLRWRDTNAVIILNIIILIFAALALTFISNAGIILESMGRDLTLTGRTEIWAGAIARIQQRPWLGYGRAAFWHPRSAIPAAIGEEIGANYIPPHAHNGFVNLACDLGLMGLFFFLLSYFLAWGRAYHRARLTRGPEHLWPLMYCSFLLLYNITESSIMAHNSALWATYMMAVLSLGRITVESPLPESTEAPSASPALSGEKDKNYSNV
jgi:O-antigen ligase